MFLGYTQHPDAHIGHGKDGWNEKPIGLQVKIWYGEDKLEGTVLIRIPLVPSQWKAGKDQGSSPGQAYIENSPAIHPESVVVQWVDDAYVFGIVYHQEVGREREEEEVGCHIAEEAIVVAPGCLKG